MPKAAGRGGSAAAGLKGTPAAKTVEAGKQAGALNHDDVLKKAIEDREKRKAAKAAAEAAAGGPAAAGGQAAPAAAGGQAAPAAGMMGVASAKTKERKRLENIRKALDMDDSGKEDSDQFSD